jgi:hypothetical protein
LSMLLWSFAVSGSLPSQPFITSHLHHLTCTEFKHLDNRIKSRLHQFFMCWSSVHGSGALEPFRALKADCRASFATSSATNASESSLQKQVISTLWAMQVPFMDEAVLEECGYSVDARLMDQAVVRSAHY